MTKEEFEKFREFVGAEVNPEALCADGFEEACIGLAGRACKPTVLAYDYDKCVKILMDRDGMSHEEATEWMDYNVTCAWMGEGTPVFVNTNLCEWTGEEQ